MNLVGRNVLEAAKKKHADTIKPLGAWAAEVDKAEWKSPQDVKNLYASASLLADNIVIFNIKGNNYRLEVQLNYPVKIVRVRWFGTHSEYDKRNRGK